jgi:hypothetical protein
VWGTDATQIPTVLDGKVWLFAVVEHWNAEGLGWHVAKIGDRYAAAQAVGMARSATPLVSVLGDEGEARGHAPELDLVLEVVGHERAAVIVAERDTACDTGGNGAEHGLDRLLPNLQGTSRLWPYLPDHRRCPRRRE